MVKHTEKWIWITRSERRQSRLCCPFVFHSVCEKYGRSESPGHMEKQQLGTRMYILNLCPLISLTTSRYSIHALAIVIPEANKETETANSKRCHTRLVTIGGTLGISISFPSPHFEYGKGSGEWSLIPADAHTHTHTHTRTFTLIISRVCSLHSTGVKTLSVLHKLFVT